ncbi:MAG: hypothetical protein H0X43_02255 [Nitrosospira sp.]|nr:hypothetical protein [Nitrosospira sp.]
MKKSFPVVILIILVVISLMALSGLARNMAQKRDFYSDPLCKAFWKKPYPYQAGKNPFHTRMGKRGKPEKIEKGQFSGKHQPYRTTIRYFSIPKVSSPITGQSRL